MRWRVALDHPTRPDNFFAKWIEADTWEEAISESKTEWAALIAALEQKHGKKIDYEYSLIALMREDIVL